MAQEVAHDLPFLDSRYQAKERGTLFGGDMVLLSQLFAEKHDKVAAQQRPPTAAGGVEGKATAPTSPSGSSTPPL